MVQYICEECNYLSNRKSNYEKHQISKRHKVAIEKSMSSEYAHMSAKNAHTKDKRVYKKIACEHCDKEFFNTTNLKRHKKSCIGLSDEKDKLIEKLLQEKNDVEKKLDKAIKENAKIGYELACSEKKNVIMNANYILNVFTDAYNIEDLMDKELTNEEKQYLTEMGGLRGCNKFINDRCIENVSVEKRPFHCVDHSRDKFLTRSNNKWEVDMNAQKILDKVTDVVTPIYPTDVTDLTQRTKNLKSITDLKSSDVNKALIKNIKGKTLLKNDVDKQLIED